MPRKKDLKRLVRTRMKKTGEAYTTARAHVTSKAKQTAGAPRVAQDQGKATDYAALAGMSDDKLVEKAGHPWEHWVRTLDAAGAQELPHRAIAELLVSRHALDGWWAQMVTVGYERIRGLRARGQRRDGMYDANKSRTYNVPVSTLFNAWADARQRKRWLAEAGVRVRTSIAPRSLRLGWPDGTIIAVGFEAKGSTKSVVALSHMKLRDKQSAERMKQYWSERLDALAEVLN